MHPKLRQTQSHLMELFDSHGFRPRTDLGQNFLIDINLVEYIVEQARLDENDVVLEVGAGTGGMTTFLAAAAGRVISIELDPNMFQLATEITEDLPNVTLLNCDVLKNKNHFRPEILQLIDETLEENPERRLKLVANLPYSVATPVISNLVATDLPWERMVVTIQLELGQRIVAQPSSSDYSALSVWMQSQCHVKLLKRLPPSVFWPRPKVNSAIVRIAPDHGARKRISDRAFFHDHVRRLFTQRRKYMRGTLAGMYRKQLEKENIDAVLDELGLSRQVRAEELPPETHVAVGNALRRLIPGEVLDE